jgi:hypothetical protein
LVYCQPGGVATSFTMSANQAQQSMTARVCGLGLSVLSVASPFYIPTVDLRSVDEEASMRQQHCLSGVVALLQSKCVSVSWDVQTSCRHLSTLLPRLYPTDLFDPKVAIWIRDSESKVVVVFDEACKSHGVDVPRQREKEGGREQLQQQSARTPQWQAESGGRLRGQLLSFAEDLSRCGMLAMELFDRLTSGDPHAQSGTESGREQRRAAEEQLCLDKCVPCEMATAALLGKMEASGILVDVEYLQRCIPSIRQLESWPGG